MQEILTIILPLGAAYALGSIPFGLLLTRLAGAGDIRAIGSGNIGATNVLRTGNKKLAALTLLLDMLKGTAGVLAAGWLGLEDGALPIAVLAATLGHIFPVWIRFKGGKGVATALGGIAAVSPLLAAVLACTWLLMAALFRISSLAALVAFIILPVAAYFLGVFSPLWPVLSLLLCLTHRANIRRLLKNEEPRLGH
ncbi:MAG: glycerol-3-phosphate 1-O-acyltransferase PlsY [Holosporales bacterium]|jgi:glycerol-3-phosphate acyltransferase PlsY